MSTSEKNSNLLVYGYLRKKLNVPKDIKKLIFLFYFLNIESQMIWDQESINKAGLCQIINDHKIKMIKGPRGYSDTTGHADWGSSAKFSYGIPVNSKDYTNIKSITWKIRITNTTRYPNAFFFIGVVSNRDTDFAANPFEFAKKGYAYLSKTAKDSGFIIK